MSNFAFPVSNEAEVNGQQGMTLRDWFAGRIAAGLCSAADSNGMWTAPIEHGQAVIVAERAYAVADALLAERTKGATS